MKKHISILLLLLFSTNCFSQEDIADYKKFEVLAKKINYLQNTANGKRLKNDKDDFTLKIPETNFIFNYYDMTASNIIGTNEGLLVFENIDLAEIEDIRILDEYFGDTGMVIITPNKKQKYIAVANDQNVTQETENIGFYFSFYESNKGKEIFNALAELILLAKVKKGLLTSKQALQLQTKWKDVETKNTAQDYYSYWKNEPVNIFTDLAYYKLSQLDKSFKIENVNTGNFRADMSQDEFKKVLVNSMANFQTEDKLLRKIKENYKVTFRQDTSGIIHPIILLHYSTFNFLRYNQYEKNENTIRELLNAFTESTDNELIKILPQGYKMGLHKAYSKNSNRIGDTLMEFWIESGDKSPIDFKDIANRLQKNYGGNPYIIKEWNPTSLYTTISGYGSKELTLLSYDEYATKFPFRFYVRIRNKSKL